MTSSRQIDKDNTPNFITFPLAEDCITDKDSGEAIPSKEGVLEVKDWVDYKEM